MLDFIIFIVLGAVAGWLAGKIVSGGGFGFIINAIIGIIGGVLGGWVFGLLGLSSGGSWGGFVTAVIGAILLLWIVSFFKKK